MDKKIRKIQENASKIPLKIFNNSTNVVPKVNHSKTSTVVPEVPEKKIIKICHNNFLFYYS